MTRPLPSSRRLGRAGAVAVASAACVAVAVPAVASADWQDVPVPDELGGSAVVADGSGALFAAVVRNRPTSPDQPFSGPSTNVRLAKRAAGGAWSSTDLTSGESDPPSGDDYVFPPSLTPLGDGRAYAFWTSRNTAPGAAAIGGTPTAALTDAPPVSDAVLTRGPGGTVVAVGQAADRQGWVSSTRSKAGAWSAPTSIPGVTGGSLRQLVVGSSGQVAAVWTVPHPTQPGRYVIDLDVVSARRTVDGTWHTPRVLAGVVRNIRPVEAPSGIATETVTAALDGQDRLTAVFATASDTPTYGDRQRDTIRAASQEPGQDWSPATTIAEPSAGDYDYCPDPARRLSNFCPRVQNLTVVGTRTGKTVAVWWDVMTQTLRAAGTDDAGRWRAPVAVADQAGSGFAQPLSVAENPVQGVVTIEWQPQTDRRLPSAPIQARDFYPWDGTVSRFYTVPTTRAIGKFSDAPISITDAGDTVLPYRWFADAQETGVTVDDASGPVLSRPTGAKTRKAGRSGTYAIAAKDTFSDLGTITWDFGDGTSATGAKVTHAWKAAGTYPVSITATDALGNRSATSTAVTVVGRKGLTTVRAALPGRGSVRVTRVRVTDGRLSIAATGPARLNVAIQHRAGRHAERFVPLTALQMDPGTAGTITARVPGLKERHHYKVIVTRRGTAGPAVRAVSVVR